MASGKFKLGDRVEVVMKGETGFGGIHLGKVGRIVDTRPHSDPWDYGVEFDEYDTHNHSCCGKGKQGYCFWGNANQLALVEDDAHKIVIIVDGDKTIARMYDGNKVIKEAVATCSPEDKFDFETGAKLAFERLELKNKEDEKVEEVKKTPKFKTGDRAIITKCITGHQFPIGTIVTLTAFPGDYKAKNSDGDWWWVQDEELSPLTFKPGDKVKIIANNCCHYRDIGSIVTISHEMSGLSRKGYVRYGVEGGGTWVTDHDIEPYTESEEPTYFKGKAICVKDKICDFVVGKVYDFSVNDGCGKNERGTKILNNPCETIEEINRIFNGNVEFIPYVEETINTPTTPKSEYYNGKVVCVKSDIGFTAGKVYEFVNGQVKDEDGDLRPTHRQITSLEDVWCSESSYHFIPYVEDAPKGNPKGNPKSKYYNGKVVCVDPNMNDYYTKGKVYEFINGTLITDDGFRFSGYKSFNEWKAYSSAKWIEFKE